MTVRPGNAKDITDAEFERLAAAARRKAVRETAKLEKLIANLHGDLDRHGDAARWKRYGDLLLANATNAIRQGDTLLVVDYFAPETPELAIEAEAGKTTSETAEGYFRRYTKSRNAAQKVAERLEVTEAKLAAAIERLAAIDRAIENSDIQFLMEEAGVKPSVAEKQGRKKIEVAFKGARRFTSSEGYEILVGKKAADNDFLTFRIAKSRDIWMHAADYPGSHVVVRKRGAHDIPHQTLIEAAQIAAFYSDARGLGKASVRYTEKKFVNKPKRAPAGRVSIADFKTLVVEPKVPPKAD